MPKIYFKHNRGWIYLAVGRWQAFDFFMASGWISLSPRWLWETGSYEIGRRYRMMKRRLTNA